ncbi:unnamed protein product [Penicillium camemberti]|uniref:Str. FM013 n=1 Tax=Penicillium camemberti (strain FM 013) TaxID=1429867 RepID=A0A0G4P1M8_PENC3|nr:unnamed protein product [Penicillium camemberti]
MAYRRSLMSPHSAKHVSGPSGLCISNFQFDSRPVACLTRPGLNAVWGADQCPPACPSKIP